MGTPSRDRDREKTKRFWERWCKHRDQKNHRRMEAGRDRETEREHKPEIQTEEETGKQPTDFSPGPRWSILGGAGIQLVVPQWRGWNSTLGGPGNAVWVPRPGSGRGQG